MGCFTPSLLLVIIIMLEMKSAANMQFDAGTQPVRPKPLEGGGVLVLWMVDHLQSVMDIFLITVQSAVLSALFVPDTTCLTSHLFLSPLLSERVTFSEVCKSETSLYLLSCLVND